MEIVFMKVIFLTIMLSLVLSLAKIPAMAAGIKSTNAEQDMAVNWAQAKLEGKEPKVSSSDYLQVIRNNDPVQLNERNGHPLNIHGVKYTRGLYCHAVSQVVVHLSSAAKSFEAVVGVDSNDQTLPVKGSIHFSVSANGNKLYSSPLIREGMPGAAINVKLNNATEVVLDVDDGGDGIACDQADWADAKITLANGEVIWLGELPIDNQTQKISVEPSFSFTYDGKSSQELLPRWSCSRSTKKLDVNRTKYTAVYTDPATKLEIECSGISYADYPVIEWVVNLTNRGMSDTPIIENIKAIDLPIGGFGTDQVKIHTTPGTTVQDTDFMPVSKAIAVGETQTYAPTTDGRPCAAAWPYFNINSSAGGAIVAVGWSGQWQTDFTRHTDGSIQMVAGQQLTHLKLHPGESIRTPLIAMLFYRGDWLRSHNLWRRWMLDHNLPRVDGKLPDPHFTPCSSHQYAEMTQADEASQKHFIDKYIENGMKPDYWWMDAGWYPCDGNWPKTGTWEPDPKRFPNGLRAVSDYAHAKGVKIIVWFEPERVYAGTWIYDNHPEWLLANQKNADGSLKRSENQLLNMGNPEALKWLTDHVDGLIKSQGIDLYRQDYNIGPLSFWRTNDADDRQGITENHYVSGYLAYWDELRRRNPSIFIDSCASGGHRNDLETMRRAIPLLRSDCLFEPNGQQGHTYGLSLWLPYYGTGSKSPDVYSIRSMMALNLIGCWDMRTDNTVDKKMLKRVWDQWRSVAGEMLGDFYPLTPYTLSNQQWMGWMYYTPEKGTGVIQLYRHGASPYVSAQFQLQGLDENVKYEVRNLDTGRVTRGTGKSLMREGITVNIKQMPGSAWYSIKKI